MGKRFPTASFVLYLIHHRADSTYATIFSASVRTTCSNFSSSLSRRVIRKPGRSVKKEVSGITQIPVAPRR